MDIDDSGKKETVDKCLSIAISLLNQPNKLNEICYMSGELWTAYSFGEEALVIWYSVINMEDDKSVKLCYTLRDPNSGKNTFYDYDIKLLTTPCNYGSVRYWFACPLTTNGTYCGRRVAKLYLPRGAEYFGCRHCYNLSYRSRSESRPMREGGAFYPAKLMVQMERLASRIQRWKYAGEPTKQVIRLSKIAEKYEQAKAFNEAKQPHISVR